MKLLNRLVLTTLLVSTPAFAQDPSNMSLGNMAITKFSGVLDPMLPLPEGSPLQMLDETFINLDGISAQINSVAHPGYVWDARIWPGQSLHDYKARDVGQVFGVALDDARTPDDKHLAPNIYLTATSAYGLQIVAPDSDGDGRPQRLHKGDKAASWMTGQWGTGDTKGQPGSKGGPGSIWKVDGVTGEVSLFANVQLANQDNAGAGLGNITYAPEVKQLFVSDLSTGMIHRFDMTGKELEIFDHGVTGRTAAKLPAVKYDPSLRLTITKSDFNVDDPESYGFADEARRVYGLE